MPLPASQALLPPIWPVTTNTVAPMPRCLMSGQAVS